MEFDVTVELSSVMKDLLKKSSYYRLALMTDLTGLSLVSVGRSSNQGNNEFAVEGMGALASALFLGAASQGSEASLGRIFFNQSDFEYGRVFIMGSQEIILVLIVDPKTQPKKARIHLRTALNHAQKTLKLNISTTKGKLPKNDSTNLQNALGLLDDL